MSFGGRWGARTLRRGATGTAAAERATGGGGEDGGEEGDDEAVVVVERTAPHCTAPHRPADRTKSVCFSGT